MDFTLILLVVGAVFLGTLMRATFGFGDSVISMPLLALLPIPFSVTVSLIGLTGLTAALLSVVTSWKDKDPIVFKKLTLATIIGIPFGLLLVQFADQTVINLLLGIVLIGYAIHSLTRSPQGRNAMQTKFENTNYAYPFGFISGMLGSAYNMNGIPVVLYATTRDWQPKQFLGNIQAHFLVSSLLIIIGHFLSGFWTRDLGVYYIFSLPAVIIAMKVGKFLYSKIETQNFRHYIFIMIFLLGVVNMLEIL